MVGCNGAGGAGVRRNVLHARLLLSWRHEPQPEGTDAAPPGELVCYAKLCGALLHDGQQGQRRARWYTHYMHAGQITSIGVTVRLFASLRELAGEQEVQLVLPVGSRTVDVWDACVQRWPALASRRRSTVLAVNREFARGETVIHDGDEVALLPPVSGGSCSQNGNPTT